MQGTYITHKKIHKSKCPLECNDTNDEPTEEAVWTWVGPKNHVLGESHISLQGKRQFCGHLSPSVKKISGVSQSYSTGVSNDAAIRCQYCNNLFISALTLLVGWQEGHPACKNRVVGCWCG